LGGADDSGKAEGCCFRLFEKQKVKEKEKEKKMKAAR